MSFLSYMITFLGLCGRWIYPMFDCMERSEDGLCVLYFLFLWLVGVVVLSLFLALLLSSFSGMGKQSYIENPIW